MRPISISEIKLYHTCQQRWHYQYVDKREPSDWEDALELGTAVHKILERKLCGIDYAQAMGEVLASIENDPDRWTFLRAELDKLEPLLAVWEPKDHWEIVATEKPLSLPITKTTQLVGRADCVVKWGGKYWHLQHKTIAASKPPFVFAEWLRTDFHEIAYEWMLREEGFTPYGGTIANLIRKLSLKTLTANPESGWVTSYLTRSPEVQARGEFEIARAVAEIGFSYENHFIPRQERSSCINAYGNKLCPFKPVCDREEKLDSPLYKIAVPRYTLEVAGDVETS